MSGNLDELIVGKCLNPQDGDCPVPPTLASIVIVKPESVLACAQPNQTIKFRAYLVNEDGKEFELTQDVQWTTNDLSIMQIGQQSGNAFAISPGIATVAATWDGKTGFAQAVVLDDCCQSAVIGLAIVIDNSKSFNLVFSSENGTRLSFAKKVAEDLVTSAINANKDTVRVSSFNVGPTLMEEFSHDVDALVDAIRAIPSSVLNTTLYVGVHDAVEALIDNEDVDYRVLVIFTDGVDSGPQDVEVTRNVVAEADRLKSTGGFVIPVAMRAHGDGFSVLSEIATKGFFVSATEDNQGQVSDWLVGLMGYVCSGNCVPVGDVDLIGHGKLNYSDFLNWDVIGNVDLIGGDENHPEFDLFDLLPGNGLYVDFRGTPGNGGLRLKASHTWVQDYTYTFTIRAAGNQRNLDQTDSLVLKVGEAVVDTIGPIAAASGFSDRVVTWVPSVTVSDAFFAIEQVASASAWFDVGSLVDSIKIVETPLVGDPVTIVDDNFDTENSGVIPPECEDGPVVLALSPGGYSPTAGLYGYAYRCYAYGCLDVPLPSQVPDPDPLIDNE
jgi:hypothetical protein